MISCTEFIPAYSELFNYIEEKGGREAVEKYWDFLAEKFLGNFKELVEKNGLRGCWMYWSHTLNEEAADFRMELDEENNIFSIEMRACPSKGKLISIKDDFDSYPDYCSHCRIYETAIGPMGYDVETELSQVDKARCKITIRKKT